MGVLSDFARLLPAVVLGVGCALATPSSAGVLVSLEAAGDTGVFPRPNFWGTRDIEFSGSVADGGSVASGFANLETGLLRSSAISMGGAGIATTAQSVLSDSFRFSAGATGTAYLDWAIEGRVSASPQDYGYGAYNYGIGGLSLYLVGPDSSAQQFVHLLSSTQLLCDAALTETTCAVGSAFSFSGSIAIPIVSGNHFVQVGLSAQARYGSADFGNTARLYMRTPDGVSIESDSGRFLASAVPIGGVVSAPATGALVFAGLALIAAARHRQSLQVR